MLFADGRPCVGAHTAQPLAALPLTDAAYPLRVVCARPPPGAAGPCIRYTEAFRLTRDGAPYGAGPPDVVRENRWRGAQCATGRLQQSGPDRTCAQCVPLVPLPPTPAAFAFLRQRNKHQIPGASRSEAGRAAADAYIKSKDGGTLSRYHPLSKSHRRRVRSTKLKIKHQSTEGALRLGVLRG